MTYRQVERAVLIVGALAILCGVLLWVPTGTSPVELIAQALIFGVLLAAVRFGPRGGFIGAVVASLIYVWLQLPILADQQLEATELLAIVLRMLSFGALGIIGGEVFMRLRYNLKRLEGGTALDEWSRVYSQNYLAARLSQARLRAERYDEPVSLIVIEVSASVYAGLSPSRQRSMVRAVADHLRSIVRTVDEVARLDDGRFAVLLPHTPTDGASVVQERTCAAVRTVLGALPESVSAFRLALPQDAAGFDRFVDSITPCDEEDQLLVSGAYSSSAASTRKPAPTSTSSAPGASTLNTSTAASPEGSTKQ